MESRTTRIEYLKENPAVSVLIVGAGINGIGTFLDLALQGVDVALVERADYCSGASAASSHMVHGGIRYLENGEFRLVREAVQERNRLLENAPHLVNPLQTTFPIFKWLSGLFNAPFKFLGLLDKPAERGAVVIKIGMLLYDFYTRAQKTVPPHVFRNKADSLKLFPKLNPDIVFTGTYYDGAMPSPERIAIELITDAVAANERAVPLNYVSMISAEGDQVTLKDEVSGETFTVQPQVVVNAGGPWIDRVNANMGERSDYIGGTKGSHIVVDHPVLREAIGENEFFFENQDGRIVLIYPLADKVLIGTSDLEIEDPDQAVITDEEVQYFIDMVERVFPTIEVRRSQIVYTLSGVRPLPSSKARSTGQISRDHQIETDEPVENRAFPVYSLIGGKWTTYRAFSEKTADTVLARLGRDRRKSTREHKIGGGKGFPRTREEQDLFLAKLSSAAGVDIDRLRTLFSRYGTAVDALLQELNLQTDTPLDNYPDYSLQEVRRIAVREDVVHLDDYVLRRSMLGKLGRITPEGLAEIAAVIAEPSGWSEDRREAEIDRVVSILETQHRLHYNQFIEG